MKETKQDQIKRLQENLQRFEHMYASDRELLKSIHRSKVVYLNDHVGRWESLVAPLVGKANIYRIHRKYNPETDTPKFPGCVLCEVKPDPNLGGNFVGFWYNSAFHPLDYAPRFGCCGYVPKEKINGVWARACMPIIFTDPDKTRILAAFSDGDPVEGAQHIPLGWVMFPDKEKE